jgi:hypothetical protein
MAVELGTVAMGSAIFRPTQIRSGIIQGRSALIQQDAAATGKESVKTVEESGLRTGKNFRPF